MNDQVTKQGQRKTNLRLVGAPVLVNTPKTDNAQRQGVCLSSSLQALLEIRSFEVDILPPAA